MKEDKQRILDMPQDFKFKAKLFNGKEFRCRKEDNSTVFVYEKGKKRWGWRFSIEQFCSQYELCEATEKDETASWRRRMRNAVKALSESGLWPNVKERFENLLAWGVTLEEKREMVTLYWDIGWKEVVPDEMEEKISEYSRKYPKIIFKNADGKWCFDTDYLHELSDCRTKTMYFGKWDNKREKDVIAKCIKDGQNYTCQHRVGYDVSFSYLADKRKAWYSEEYRGCGNGHYYLALNNSVALFYEND